MRFTMHAAASDWIALLGSMAEAAAVKYPPECSKLFLYALEPLHGFNNMGQTERFRNKFRNKQFGGSVPLVGSIKI
jgi:hypothetical protein